MALTADDFRGRVVDCDSHENLPVTQWGETFGPAAGTLAEMYKAFAAASPDPQFNDWCREGVVDDTHATPETVRNIKGCSAPGAIDFSRRPAVLDAMGIDRQIVYPTMALMAAQAYLGYAMAVSKLDLGGLADEVKKLGEAAVREYNDWCVRTTKELNTDRVRILPFVFLESLEQMMSEVEEFLAAGARGILSVAASPPAGTSPANPELDPFWALLEEANVPFIIHGGSDLFCLGKAFSESPTLETNPKFLSPEFPNIGVYTQTFLEVAPAHFLGTMVLGGVFERHPDLRCGIIECKAMWLPLLSQQMELWTKVMQGSERGSLSMKPSEYLARNVRVTPFVFEPFVNIIEQAPELVDCYAFGSDYPHAEGGRNADHRFSDMIAPLGNDIAEKFFVTNGKLLLPD